MDWQLIETLKEKRDVLLFWPGEYPIIRIGSLLYKPILADPPIFKLDLDYGDAGAWVFTNRDDGPPTHWMALPTAPTIHELVKEAA